MLAGGMSLVDMEREFVREGVMVSTRCAHFRIVLLVDV